ncbi:FMN-binding negative transcriptional regulator [Leeuwenhoekiella polynyae]|uniref:PaiB family negative transcriptional regulator n=1 Tax=Leeuwenhoekiella polynyae TaxID=1550906 RepID=A0A4V1KNW7_9FLAO|nr:FMN-binding negative transcriptional regulator [Leeuwenhoekiella polynyae]RXG12497.1 PaiB family negative transcriptional regulator [Leeuwenhoekiella polynyae]
MSLYPPQHHQESQFKNVIKTIETFPLAQLISVYENKPIITHLPLRYSRNEKFGMLSGHIDNNNPQLKNLKQGVTSTIVFNGPDTYISPSIYNTKQLPTWNYIKVHLEGKVNRILSNDELKMEMIELTKFLEGSDQKYILEKEDPRMEAFVNYVTGFELEITAWEGKFKLSQDKNKKDQTAAKQALTTNYTDVIPIYLDSVYTNHIKKG